MRITIEQKTLSPVISAIVSAMGTGGESSSGILLEGREDGTLRVSAYSNREHLEMVVPCVTEEEGSVVVGGDKTFSSLVSSLSGRELSMETMGGGTTLRIEGGKGSEYTLPTLSSVSRREFPEHDGGVSFSVPASDFLGLVSMVTKSASNKQDRPILEGVLCEVVAGKVILAATDSYRVTMRTTVPASHEGEGGCVIHRRSIDLLSKMSKIAGDGELLVAMDPERRATFSVGNSLRMSVSTLENATKYPKISRLIPSVLAVDVLVDRKELQGAVKRASLFISEPDFNPLALEFGNTGELRVVAKSSASTVGTGAESMGVAETFLYECDDDYHIGLNTRFLSEGLASIKGDAMRIRCTPVAKDGVGGVQLMILSEADEGFPEIQDFYLVIAFRLA